MRLALNLHLSHSPRQSDGLRCKKRLWRDQGRRQLEAFPLAPLASRRRGDLLEVLDRLNPTITELTQMNGSISARYNDCSMDTSSIPQNRQQRLYSVASILIVVAATFVKVFPFSGHLLGVGVALGITLLRQPDRIRGWFARLRFRSVMASAVVYSCALLATDFALLKLLPAAGLPAVDFSRFHALRGDARATALWIAGIWVLVSPSEELISRAFLIDQWSAVLEGLKGAPVLAVVASALTFGAVHFYEGPTGVINNGIAGLWLEKSLLLP